MNSAMAEQPGEVTVLLGQVAGGERGVESRLFRIVYSELRSIARKMMHAERPGHPLQATALVNEAYLRLFRGAPLSVEGSQHFYRLAARAMRLILIDAARRNHAGKRDAVHVTIDERQAAVAPDPDRAALLCLAMRRLARRDARAAKVVELHYLSGQELDEIARALGVTRRTVERDLATAKLWLNRELRTTNTN
jgi:RNA polymerase sigma factor (TIGR02999 family)